MRRPELTIAAAVSLLLACGVVLLWVRSYRQLSTPGEADGFDFTDSDPYWWIISNPGRLTFCHQVGRDWNSPLPRFQFLGLELAASRVGRSSLTNLLVPYWMLLVPTLVFPCLRIRAALHDRRTTHRMNRGLCGACGYDLRGSHTRCPECGASIARAQAPPA